MSERNYLHRPKGSPQPRERESQKVQLESLPHGENKDVKRQMAYKTGEKDWEVKARSMRNESGALIQEVQSVLNSDEDLKGYGLRVTGSGGEVSLTGVVDTLSESKRAEELAADFPGVEKVVNDLTISTDGDITDADVTKEVREELNADPRVNLAHIGAESHGGTVILMGSTGDPAEIDAAKEAAARARGVRKVASQVKIKDGLDMSLDGLFHSQVRNDEENR